jgi:hypothetical protein
VALDTVAHKTRSGFPSCTPSPNGHDEFGLLTETSNHHRHQPHALVMLLGNCQGHTTRSVAPRSSAFQSELQRLVSVLRASTPTNDYAHTASLQVVVSARLRSARSANSPGAPAYLGLSPYLPLRCISSP